MEIDQRAAQIIVKTLVGSINFNTLTNFLDEQITEFLRNHPEYRVIGIDFENSVVPLDPGFNIIQFAHIVYTKG